MVWVRRVFVLALFVGLLVAGWDFAARNSSALTVDGIVYRFEGVQVWMALVTAFFAGVGLSGLAFSFSVARARLVQRRYRQELNALESEVHQLRNLGVAMPNHGDDILGDD